MGSEVVNMQVGTPINNSLIALIITEQTERVMEVINSDPSHELLLRPINFRGDTILHYACARNNIKLVSFLLQVEPSLKDIPNKKKQHPIELTTNE